MAKDLPTHKKLCPPGGTKRKQHCGKRSCITKTNDNKNNTKGEGSQRVNDCQIRVLQ